MQNKFFGSKLNTVLLLVLIVLMVFALRIMLKDNETHLPFVGENEEINLSKNNIEQELENINTNINTWTGEPLGENQFTSLQKDLNGDGIVEDISYEIAKTWNQNRLIVNINTVHSNASFVPPAGDSNPANFFGIVDINTKDTMQEIALQDYGPSDDFNVTFLGWNGKEFISYGNIPGDYTRMKFDGNGKITTRARGYILQTWFYEADYVLSGSKIISSPRDFYEIVDGPQDLMMLQDLSVVKSQKDSSVVATFKKGEKIQLIGCDDIAWCKAKNQAGIEGWFALENFDQIKGTNFSARDVFEGLSYAD